MSHFDPQRYRPAGNPLGPAGPAAGPPARPVNPARPAPRQSGGLSTGISHAVGYAVVIWAVFTVNWLFFGMNLNAFGIHPLDPSALWGILTAPLLHANVEHLLSNTLPGMVFAFIIGMSGKRVFWEVTLIVVAIAGVGTWLFGGVGTNHIGASGLVYGWLGYLLLRGIFNRSLSQILVGVVLGFFYSGLVWGILPGTPGVSWQGHLFGALGGVAAGMFITSDDPVRLRARRQSRRNRALEDRLR